ncbi:MAG: glycosyltransferase family 2 protein [Paludibacteraceae bacterium]|nr:glycosyltransferase family 2 protein [Paludibacteraceae bacterium]
MNTPLVSVIVPVYGVEKYIERCARSLFEQTLESIEYIFVDDCTPDNSIEVLKKVLEDYSHRKEQTIIYKMSKNSGQAAVRKCGVLQASGEYIIHCDSDDWVDRNMYKEMYDKAKLGDYDMVICDYYTSDGNIHNICSSRTETDKNIILSNILTQKIACSLCNKLVRRKCYNESFVFPTYNNGEDLAMVIQLVVNSSSFAYTEKGFYYYYMSPNSITRNVNEKNILRNCHQACYNAKFVSELLVDKYGQLFANDIIHLKYLKKNIMLSLVLKNKYLKEWRKIFPEINSRILFVSSLTIREKIKFCLIFMGLYSFLLGRKKYN